MNKKYYELLGVTEEMSDEQISEAYETLKKKYSEERFLEGEAGNEAAKMLNKIDVAYNEIMTERRESRMAGKSDSSYTQVEELIRDGKYAEAEKALDAFNERPAHWHYLQSVVFYRKNWVNESKKQLEIAMHLDAGNQKYKDAYQKLNDKMAYDASNHASEGANQSAYRGQDMYTSQDNQMGGNFCTDCLTCCYINMCINCLCNACCN